MAPPAPASVRPIAGLNATAEERQLWGYYFPGEEPTSEHEEFYKKLRSYAGTDAFRAHTPQRVLELGCAVPVHKSEVTAKCPWVLDKLAKMPHMILSLLHLVVHQALLAHPAMPVAGASDVECWRKRMLAARVHARFLGFDPVMPMRDLKSHNIGRFVSLRGNVVRVSNMRPLVATLEFECARCRRRETVHVQDGKYVARTICSAESCRSKALGLSRSSARMVDWQKIRLQELPSEDAQESGRVPRTVEVELTHDLVDSCVPGDTVTISGVVKAESVEEHTAGRPASKANKTIWVLYVDANSVAVDKNARSASEGGVGADPGAPVGVNSRMAAETDVHFSPNELEAIRAIHSEPDLFKLVVNSLSPGIFGHELVKAGLALTLFGGTPRVVMGRGGRKRSDPHMLIVGDPGMGKSQMLNYLSMVAPRGVYVCGNTTSSTGLTVTVVRDPASGDFALEAGALVLADRGVCCIDEFDKMTPVEHQALLEAMEQQQISVAKAGIVCSLPARASVIAAANPTGGHYNRARTVAENLRMSAPILSRFDLIFILLDAPDRNKDRLLSRHVFAMHGARKVGNAGQPQYAAAAAAAAAAAGRWSGQAGHADWQASRPLAERLVVTDANFDPVPPVLLRKYIEYARAHVRPQLSDGACALLKSFYLQLRSRHRGSECGAITTRQLESLMRLSEARAKLELLEEVTEAHVQDVIDIMKESLYYDHMADLGMQLGGGAAGAGGLGGLGLGLGGGRANAGSGGSVAGLSKSNLAKRFIAALEHAVLQKRDAILTTDEVRRAYQSMPGADPALFDAMLGDLNQKCHILMKPEGNWKVTSSVLALSAADTMV